MKLHLPLTLLTSLHFVTPSTVLRFQSGDAGYSTEEWAEFTGTIPHLDQFTVCHWERLRFFSIRDTCIWAFCHKKNGFLKCTQIWYNRDVESGGRYIRPAGRFGDDSYQGKTLDIFKN